MMGALVKRLYPLGHSAARHLPGSTKPAIRGAIRRVAISAGVMTAPVDSAPATSAASIRGRSLAFPDFNHYLHGLRTAELVRLPVASRCLLSAGPSSAEYFTWVESNSGTVPLHIGVEAYRPAPANLPSNAQWVRNTVGDLSDISTASCDVMFSGQNFEHLWPSEVTGSLCEAWRVLSPGGHLVMDSPNRAIAHAYNWTQPEHTVEYTPAEATDLLTLAGFDVIETRGLHLCRDPRTGELMPFDPLNDEPQRFLERVQLAADYPDHSFVWWITARRSDREPARAALDAEANRLFETNWTERMGRVSVSNSIRVVDDDTLDVPAHVDGFVRFGPYCPIPPGEHRTRFEVRVVDRPTDLEFDVVANNGALKLATLRVAVQPKDAWQTFELKTPTAETLFAVECRVRAFATGRFELKRAARLDLAGFG